uniref:RNA-directed DNA polymerase n=1 Tax=Tanacetum cinerariifolium TaxID=118510 RepID=A0A699HPN6_TANCI|nr:reverse transcriptase domain-containing protein [Tanacetum cinerariifolium]
MSTRSSARNLFSPLDNPELTIRRRPRVDPTLLNDFEMATNENGDDVPPLGGGDLPVPDLRTKEELCQPTLNGDDANKHLDKFLHVTKSIKVNGVTDDALYLYLFPHSLTHHAIAWFDRLPRNSITTFEQMDKMFLGKYFPPSMVMKLRNEITNFRQRLDESLFEAWERYKLSIDRCPNHNMLPVTQIDTFYNGLTLRHRDTINAAAGGTFMKRPTVGKLIMYMLWEPIIKVVILTNLKMNTASSSGSGTLPSNTITNPKEDLKGITTRSGNAYKGPTIPTTSSLPKVMEREIEVTEDTVPPTNNESTKDVQPPVVQIETLIPNSNLVVAPVVEPVEASVSAPKPNLKPSIPYPSRLHDQKLRDKANDQKDKFFKIFQDLNFNISFADALILMPKFGLTIKSLPTNKEKLFELARTSLNEHCSAVLLKKLPEKLEDPGKFLIPCDFLKMDECLALADLSVSINLMPLFVWNKLSLPELSPTCMTLKLADHLISHPVGVAEDVFVKVETFHFPTDFVVVDFDADPRVSLILERSFLKTGRALIDVYEGELTLRVGKEAVTFNLDQTSRYSANYDAMSVNRNDLIDVACEDDFLLEETDAFLAIADEPISLEIDDCYYDSEGDILLLEEFLNDDPSSPPLPPQELKGDDKLPVLIAKELNDEEKPDLIKVLKSHKQALAWQLSDIKGIALEFCTHKILMEDDFKPAVQHQRRVNPKIHEVIKKEVLKLLDVGLIYPISDSPWVVKAKIDVIAKLPHPTTVNGISSFFGHVGFYQRFIQDFSKIARPMTRLLEKDTPFFFSKECIEAFQTLKRNLTEAPILVAPDWDLPFELMCDASDFAIGAVLGQRKTNHFQPIHYASKTMTDAQAYYTITEKELLAVVYAFEKFWPYLVLSKSIVYTDHLALKYLFNKQDAKPRLLRWVLLLQEFDITVHDKKGAENLAIDHLFGTPRAIISDRSTHFCNDQFAKVMLKYGVTHRLATAYHPQTSRQVKVSNRGLKRILERTVGENHASWSDKLDDALWAFRTAFKTPIVCTSYKLVYEKACHLPIELEHKAYWALKHCNYDLLTAEKTKRIHDSKIKYRVFNVGDRVLLFNSRLKIFSGKLKTRWSGPFIITKVFPYGTVELSQTHGPNFKVNGHRLKHYFGEDIPKMVVPDIQTFSKDQ